MSPEYHNDFVTTSQGLVLELIPHKAYQSAGFVAQSWQQKQSRFFSWLIRNNKHPSQF
jgi:hypothetical protein